MEKKHNIDKFQGYPHYPDNQDITRAKNNNGRLRIDENETTQKQQAPVNDTIDERDDEVSIVQGTEADVTQDDLRMLEAADQNMDTQDAKNLMASALDKTDEDGDLLNVYGSLDDNVTGDDLDVPGVQDDDVNESIGEEDEENNYYSLGGDLHENQEENKGE